MIVFATTDYLYLQQEIILQNTSLIDGKIEIKLFPDGESYHRILTDVSNKAVVIIGGTSSDKATLELFDIAEGIVQLGAHSLTIVIPYFGYSTMERVVLQGEVVKARSRALLFSAIPSPANPVNVILFDLHSEGIPYYFDSKVRTKHVYCKQIIMEVATQLGGLDFVLAATDAGRAKWVESLAAEMNVQAAFVYKNRIRGNQTEITGINADVKNKTVIIYDDMIRTGGSLMKAAEQYHLQGANKIIVITTHGLFNNDAIEKIEKQGIIQQIVCTNSHPNVNQISHPLLQVKSIARLIMQQF